MELAIRDLRLWDPRECGAYQGVKRIWIPAALTCAVSWASWASASPGVIIAARVEALAAPSKEANVISELGHGAQVCILDGSRDAGLVFHRPGWLAIRLPAGVGYVPVEAIAPMLPAPDVADCGGSPGGPAPPALPASPGATPPLRSIDTSAALDRSALLAGRFLLPPPARFLFTLGAGVTWLDSQVASAHQIGDSGVGLHMTAGVLLHDIVMLSASIAFTVPEDHASFSQDVMPVGGDAGDARSAGSDLTVGSASVAAGLRTPFLALGLTSDGWVGGAVYAQYGVTGISANRLIANCSDCRNDSIDLDGGKFVLFGLDLRIPAHRQKSSYGVTFTYQHYLGGTFTDEARLGFSWWFG